MSNSPSLEEYVSSKGMGLDDIVKLYRDWVDGRLVLVDPDPPRTFPDYILRLDYSLWYWTIIGLSALTLLAVYLSDNIPYLTGFRYVLGSIFVLFLPGYSLVNALYTGNELSPLEELALSIGLSLAVVPLIGLVLNYTPFGIRLGPVILSLVVFILVLATIGLYRRYVRVIEEQLVKRSI
ncbi:DUF1616 domain-containing protein [Thermogladius sp. 4427co]|uniref:DUF1616 domain-containing protein n=1 Tax=Thermogladius sp. 4427co TaxID=3450718 RepID=UPI003F7990F5